MYVGSTKSCFAGEPKCQRADLRKLPNNGRVRAFFLLSASGSREVVAANPRKDSSIRVAVKSPAQASDWLAERGRLEPAIRFALSLRKLEGIPSIAHRRHFQQD